MHKKVFGPIDPFSGGIFLNNPMTLLIYALIDVINHAYSFFCGIITRLTRAHFPRVAVTEPAGSLFRALVSHIFAKFVTACARNLFPYKKDDNTRAHLVYRSRVVLSQQRP
jgi:hypothetical protein